MYSFLFGILGNFMSLVSKVLDIIKESKYMRAGREELAADIAKDEIEINRKQTEILVQDRSKEEVVKRLEDGSF